MTKVLEGKDRFGHGEKDKSPFRKEDGGVVDLQEEKNRLESSATIRQFKKGMVEELKEKFVKLAETEKSIRRHRSALYDSVDAEETIMKDDAELVQKWKDLTDSLFQSADGWLTFLRGATWLTSVSSTLRGVDSLLVAVVHVASH